MVFSGSQSAESTTSYAAGVFEMVDWLNEHVHCTYMFFFRFHSCFIMCVLFSFKYNIYKSLLAFSRLQYFPIFPISYITFRRTGQTHRVLILRFL